MLLIKRVFVVIMFFMLPITVNATSIVETSKDTRFITDQIEINDVDLSEFELLEETEFFMFYFRDDRDIIAVYDKRNGYTWKSGIDIEYSKDIKNECRDAYDDENLTSEERVEICRPIEDRLNTTFTGIANSLVTLEYFDATLKVKRISSASHSGAESELKKVSPGKYELDIYFSNVFIRMKAIITFSNDGFDIEIADDSISGRGVENIASILLNPFMGASGGQETHWDPEEEKYNIDIQKEMIDGYVFVPDGSGSLIRFNDYDESLQEYDGDVYGIDQAQSLYDQNTENFYVPFKHPTMPVYGISHGYRQAAFLGYASSGDEYLEFVVTPEENMTYYTWAYPKFVYNKLYYQVYNQQGAGYFSVFEERNHFDIHMNYEFLSNGTEDGYPADYVGMAKSYRDYLEEENLLDSISQNDDLPMRVDFIMSDSKQSIFGYKNIYMTNTDDVDEILTSITSNISADLSVGLLGWQDGGVTMQDPYKADFTRKIGTRSDFDYLFEKYSDIDISFVEEYVDISADQVRIRSNAAKHASMRYIEYWKSWELIYEFAYASPVRSVEWMEKQAYKLRKIDQNSFTYDGIGNNLISDYKYDLTVSDSMDLITEFFQAVDSEVNIVKPNQYLWKYTDRFLEVPMFSTQHLIETDTVPFLQIVINGSMEVFAPYTNFSFNKQKDILRMIDYNVAPSILLTQESAHKMASTNSGQYYSTAYENYDDIIQRVYEGVSEALNEVRGLEWLDREVLNGGVIMNTYESGKTIIINYSANDFTYLGETVHSESYKVYG